jgi:hypothetical protein
MKSRKLWVFIGLVLLVVSDYFFGLGIPTSDVLYLIILGASYILGQGYVDAKRQSVSEFPLYDVMTIIQAELKKLDYSNNFPMEKILNAISAIIKTNTSRK